jgi:acetyl esterase
MSYATHSTPNYEKLLDKEMWAFITKTNGFFPVDAATLSIGEQRALYNDMCRAFTQQPAKPIERNEYLLSERDVPVREYRTELENNNLPIVIYYHGGGFVVGDLNSHDDICASICAFTDFKVISVDYKLAPEFRHPHAFEDAYAVFQSVALNTTQAVLVVGDSAGATLAASVSSLARNSKKQPSAQVLIYPYLGGPSHCGSYVEHAHAPMLSTSDMKYYDQMRIDPSQAPPNDETFAPLWSTDFTGLPPTAVFAAQCDPLCDDGEIYAKHIRSAGGNARCTIEPGLVHGYLRARHGAARAKESFNRILLAIQTMSSPPDNIHLRSRVAWESERSEF